MEARRAAHASRWVERVRALFRQESAILSSRPNDWKVALRAHAGQWRRLLLEIWRDAAQEFGGSFASRLGARLRSRSRDRKAITEDDLPVDDDLPQWDFEPWSETYAKRAAGIISRRVSQVVETTRRAVSRAVKKAEKAGQAFSQAVTNVFQSFVRRRAQVIAEEESRTAAASAEAEAATTAESAGIEMTKEWISQRDSRVRASHARCDSERVPRDGVFSNGLRYPKDPAGPPEEVMNCRCHLVWGYRPPT